MPKSYWGIDIGSSTIKAVRAELSNDQVLLTDSAMIPIAAITEDLDPTVFNYEGVVNALKILVADKALEGFPVAVSISGRNVFSRYFNLPPVEDIDSLIPLEAKMQIPFPLEEVVWDYHVFGVNEETMETDVAIFAVKKDIIDLLLSALSECKLNPQFIQSSAFATLNFGVLELGLEKPLVMLEGGARNIDVVICDNANFWPRNLPINGTSFTKALQSKFQIPFEEAEKLKTNLKESGQSDRIFKVIEPTLKELLGEFQRSIGFYRSQRKELNIDKILLTGNALRIPGLDAYLSTGMSKDAIYIDRPVNIEIATPDEDGGGLLQSDYGSFAIAIGLAVQGLGVGFVKVNFVPKEILLAQLMKKKIGFLVGGLALLALTIFLGWYESSSRAKQNYSFRDLAKKSVDATNESKNTYESLVNETKNIETTLKSHDKYLDAKRGRLQLLNLLISESVKEADDKRKVWVHDMVPTWVDRMEAYRSMSTKWSDLALPLKQSKEKVCLIELEGLANNAEGDGLENLRLFKQKLQEFKFDERMLVGSEIVTMYGEEIVEVKQVSKPKLFVLSQDQIESVDHIGRERFNNVLNRVNAIKDVQTNFFKFKVRFYVDFEVLKLSKNKTADDEESE